MKQHEMLEVETVPQVARRWGVTRGRVHQLVAAGRFGANARLLGRDWIILGKPEPFDFMRKKKDVALDTTSC